MRKLGKTNLFLQSILRWNELFTCIKTHNETVHIGPTMFYSILTNSSDLEDLEIVYPVKYSICPTEMRDNHSYIRDYILLANFIVMAFLPFLILTVINTMLYKTITRTNSTNKRSNNRQKRDQGIAMILAGIVVVFAFCNVFRIVINLYEVCLHMFPFILYINIFHDEGISSCILR